MFYHSFDVKPKRRGRKARQILAPIDELKTIQRAILEKLLSHVSPHPAATAFFAGRSIVSNARQHHGCRYLYKTDISDFFPSVTTGMVLDGDEALALAIDEEIRLTKKDSWRGNKFKEKEVRNSIKKHVADPGQLDVIFELVWNQDEY
jgi:hypothetical protein